MDKPDAENKSEAKNVIESHKSSLTLVNIV